MGVDGTMKYRSTSVAVMCLNKRSSAGTSERRGRRHFAARGDGAARAPASDDARRRRVASDARIRDREFDLVVVSSRTHLYLATRKCGRAET